MYQNMNTITQSQILFNKQEYPLRYVLLPKSDILNHQDFCIVAGDALYDAIKNYLSLGRDDELTKEAKLLLLYIHHFVLDEFLDEYDDEKLYEYIEEMEYTWNTHEV